MPLATKIILYTYGLVFFLRFILKVIFCEIINSGALKIEIIATDAGGFPQVQRDREKEREIYDDKIRNNTVMETCDRQF